MTEPVDDPWSEAFEHIPDEVEQSVLDELNAALVLEVDPDSLSPRLAALLSGIRSQQASAGSAGVFRRAAAARKSQGRRAVLHQAVE
jgi:hypothetical protein